MRLCVKIGALALLVSVAAAGSTYATGLGRFVGPGGGCSSCCNDCGCEPSCGFEPGCGCEPACGCGAYCIDGRKFAGKSYNCCCNQGLPMRGCVGPDPCCDPGCGVPCEPSCGCYDPCAGGAWQEPSCGCGVGSSRCRPLGCGGVLAAFGRMCSTLVGCSGCGCEPYWSEWHNDPPRCCDPCDRCGNWTGPGYGYQAPYAHDYHVGGESYYAGRRPAAAVATRPTTSAKGATVARRPPAPTTTNNRAARKPQQPTTRTYQR